MAKHSPQQIKHHIEVIDSELAAKRDTLPKLSLKSAVDRKIRAEFLNRISTLKQALAYWNNEYRKITGKSANVPRAKTFTQMEAEAKREQDRKTKRRQAEQNYKDAVRNDYLKLKSSLNERRGLKQMLQNHISKNWHVMFLITLSGGRSWTNLMLIESTLFKKADNLLQQANREMGAGRHRHAVALLENAATYLNTAGTELTKFQDSLQTGTDRVVTTIKVTSSIMAPQGAGLSTSATVGMSLFKSSVEHGTELVAQGVDSKRVVSSNELKNAAKNVLIEGGSSAAGEFGKNLLAGPMASLIYKGKPTEAQITAIGNVISEYYSANSKQLLVAIKDIADGKKPTYNMMAGLIAPVLKSKPHGSLPKNTGEILSEDQVAKELESLVKKGE
jgi:hypothetical protein